MEEYVALFFAEISIIYFLWYGIIENIFIESSASHYAAHIYHSSRNKV